MNFVPCVSTFVLSKVTILFLVNVSKVLLKYTCFRIYNINLDLKLWDDNLKWYGDLKFFIIVHCTPFHISISIQNSKSIW